MATAIEEHVKETLKCVLCHETLTDPRTLPCMHTYCCKCLDKLDKKKQGQKVTLSCPECRQVHAIPAGGVAKFQVNYTTNTLVDMLHSMEVSEKAECTLCKEKHQKDIEATSKCIQCNKQLCTQCHQYHDMFLQGHAVIDLTSDKTQDMDTSLSVVKRRTVYCKTHTTNPLEIYCKADNQVVCATCYVTKHSGHQCMDVQQAAEDNVKLIDELIKKGDKLVDTYEMSIQSTQTKKDTMENEADNITHELNNDMNVAIQAIRDKYTKDINLVAEKRATCAKQAVTHLEHLQMQKAITKSIMSQLGTLKQHGHATQLANMAQDISAKSKAWDTPKNTDFDSNITFRLQKGKVFNDKIMFGKVDIENVKDKAPQTKQKVPAVLEIMGSTKVVRLGNISKRIQDIAVTDNDKIITTGYRSAASMYNKDLSLKATIHGAFSCVATKDDKIYLTNQTNTIEIYNQDGIYNRDLKIPSLELCQGIAVISKGELIVCDIAIQAVYHIDSATGKILTQTKQALNAQFVAVNSKDVVLVCSYNTHCVVGMTRDGTELFRYGTLGAGQNQLNQPGGLCTDKADNIIVADWGNQRIHLLTPNGKFIKYLLTASDGLWNPTAVAVDNEGHLLVGENRGNIFRVKYAE